MRGLDSSDREVPNDCDPESRWEDCSVDEMRSLSSVALSAYFQPKHGRLLNFGAVK